MRILPVIRSLTGLAVVAAAVSTLTVSTDASATVVIIPSLEEMTRRADVVVHGRVGEVTVAEREGAIVTSVLVEVIDGWKGAKTGEVVTLTQRGGTANGRREEITGNHTWDVGEEFVLFGVKHGDGVIAYGVGVGKFRVDRTATVPVVDEILGDVVAAEPGADGKLRMVTPKPRARRPLAELKSDVLAFAAKGQLQPGERLSPTSSAPKIKQLKRLGKLPGEEG